MTSKSVLVVGPQAGLAAHIAQDLEASNMQVSFVADDELDWQDPKAVPELFARHQPELLLHDVNFRDPALLKRQAQDARDALRARNQALATACVQHGCVAMLLSDYHVFGGDTKNAYDEADQTAPLDCYGQWLVDLEQDLVSRLDKHLILRLSWLIDAQGDNHLTRILEALVTGEQLVLSQYRRGAPTWQADARRVICGVLRQVMTGAENWGYFHYCSADSCNEWEFGCEVQATLSELREISGKIIADERKDGRSFPLEPASATLNSRRIRDNFGVHGRSWRQGLKAQINQWLDHQAQKEPLRLAE